MEIGCIPLVEFEINTRKHTVECEARVDALTGEVFILYPHPPAKLTWVPVPEEVG